MTKNKKPVLNILDIVERVEKHQVNSETGAGESVVYETRHGNERKDTRAFISFGVMNEDKGHMEHREDKVTFSSVDLGVISPVRRDRIIYDNQTFLVESYVKVNRYSSLYDIVTISQQSMKFQRKSEFI